MVLEVEGNKQKVLKTKVLSDCFTGENRKLSQAVVGELKVTIETVTACGSLQILINKLENGAGVRQT